MPKPSLKTISITTEIAFNIYWSIKRFKNATKWFHWKNLLIKEYYNDRYVSEMNKYINKLIANNKCVRYVELNPIINMAYMAGVIKNEELMVFNTCFPPSRLSINSWLLRDWNHTSFPSDIRDQEIEGGMFKQWADLSIIYSDRVGFMFMEWILEDYIEKNAEQIRQILVSNFWLWLILA